MSTARHIWQPLWQLPSRAELIFSFAKRELLGRYKGSALGIAWAVLTPVVMIAIFTFIFAGIFGARFGANDSHWDYALYLFCGLLPWSMFQESVQQSANTILAHSNLVKRVVFPLEALPAAQVFAALGSQLFATVALLIAMVIIRQRLELTGLWLPVLLIPQVLFALGLQECVGARQSRRIERIAFRAEEARQNGTPEAPAQHRCVTQQPPRGRIESVDLRGDGGLERARQ